MSVNLTMLYTMPHSDCSDNSVTMVFCLDNHQHTHTHTHTHCRLRDKCCQVLLLATSHCCKAEELLWKKAVYDLIQRCKLNKEVCK